MFTNGTQHKLGILKALGTPIVFGSRTYSMAVKFAFDGPESNGPLGLIVADEDVEDLGGGLKRIVCKRAFRKSSYTKIAGAGDATEVEFNVLMGGNVAAAIEPERVHSWNDDESTNGLNLRTRARPRHCVLFRGRRYNIASVDAFSVPPGSVSFHGDTDQIGPGRPDHDISDLVVIPKSWSSGDIYFSESGSDLRDNCVVEWTDSVTPAADAMERRVFEVGAPDYNPPDAAFSDEVAEYHFDAPNRRFRFGTIPTFTTLGADGVRATVYHGVDLHAQELTPEGANSPVVIMAADEAAGYAATGGDELVLLSLPLMGEIDAVVLVEAGVGSVEIRDGQTDPSAAMASVLFEFGAGITERLGREEQGGALDSHAGTASYAGEFEIRMQWDGSEVVFSHRAVGETSWNAMGAIPLVPSTGGSVGVGTWTTEGVRVRNLTLPLALTHLQAQGTAWARWTHSRSAKGFADYEKPNGATSITEVRNLTTDTVMTEYGTAGEVRRDVWQLAVGNVRLFSESSGDLIRVTCASGTPPAGTGRPPRVTNQVNWATDDGTGQATSNVNQNRANWRDAVVVRDPRGTLDIAAGETAELRDDAFADDGSPPTFAIDIRQRGDRSTWFDPAPEDHLAFWPDGLVLLEQGFANTILAGLADHESLCARAKGLLYRKRGTARAKNYNEVARAFDCLDEASVDGTVPFGVGADVSGLDYGMSPYPANWTCWVGPEEFPAHKWTAEDMAFGTRKEQLHPFSDGILAAGGAWGHYLTDPFTGTLIYRDSAKHTFFYSSGVVGPPVGSGSGTKAGTENCPESGLPPELTDVRSTHDENEIGEHVFDIYRGGVVGASGLPPLAGIEDWHIEGGVPVGTPGPPPTNYFGAFLRDGVWVPYEGVQNNLPSAAWSAEFGFTPLGFTVPDWIASLPEGTTIISARWDVRFSGLRQSSWENTVEVVRDGIYKVTQEYRRDGATLFRYSGPGNGTGTWYVNYTPPNPTQGGTVTWALIGIRKRSLIAELLGGGSAQVTADEFRGLGNGLSIGEAADGEWSIVDVTGMIQALVDNLDSDLGSFMLWPTTGLSAPTASPGALAQYLEGLAPVAEVELLPPPTSPPEDGYKFGYRATVRGKYTWYGSVETGTILVSYRLPNGVLEDREIVLWQPPLIAGFE